MRVFRYLIESSILLLFYWLSLLNNNAHCYSIYGNYQSGYSQSLMEEKDNRMYIITGTQISRKTFYDVGTCITTWLVGTT